jgi:uncharacterized Zn finger protein
MPKQPVKREKIGRLIAQTSGAISMIDDSHYNVSSTSGNNTYSVNATRLGWTCSCPDYARHNAKCKHVYAVEFLSQSKLDPTLNPLIFSPYKFERWLGIE